MRSFESITVLVMVGLAILSVVSSQSCDVRECPNRRVCVEEEVCRVNRRSREICRTRVSCVIVKVPRPPSNCSLIQCASKSGYCCAIMVKCSPPTMHCMLNI